MSDVLNYQSDCIFCRIIRGEIPSTKVYEDTLCYAFRDIEPAAPAHILIVPKAHIASAAEIGRQNSALVAHIYEVAAKLAEQEGLTGGWRVVTNVGADAGQTVMHLHFHLLGGKLLGPMA